SEIYILLRAPEQASEASLQAVQRNPRSPQAFFSLGWALYCGSMFELATNSLSNALSLDPQATPARLLLANIYLKLNDRKKALGQLDLYLQSAGGAQRATFSKMRTQLRRGELQQPFELPLPGKPDVCGQSLL